ncbi:MAG: Ig-like domain-containing protein, partial [Fimbriimonadaceae bacterium]
MRKLRVGMVSMMVLAAAAVMAGNATIELGSFPTMSVADGRSTVTVSALIRDAGGNLVPNGTRVVFSCDRGSFREAVVTTQNGVARAVLQAGNVAGLAKISVSAITYQATATMDYEFVSDRSLLSSAKEYVDIVAPHDLRYSMDLKTIEASGADRTAV